ncbi:MAG: carbohydrate ABC transporter permease [Paenibacillaceae bacterium]|nr:carbohydrate ABC transporter permease [Paenibacillaceae bacterium]
MSRRWNWQDVAFNGVNYTLLLLLGVCTLYPFLNLVAISLNESVDSLRGGITVFPRKFTLSNYQIILQNRSMYTAAMMSVLRTLLGTMLALLCTTMVAYCISRQDYVFRKPLNLLIVTSMYVNGGLIPYYLLIKELHMTNSFLVYIIPSLIGAFNVILIRSYFDQLPHGLIESAKLDGANDFQVLFRVMVPISLPVLATVTLYIAVMHWNSWFDNYLFNSKASLSLLQFELWKVLVQSIDSVTTSAGDSGRVDEEILKLTTPQSIRATITVVVTLPIIFVYPFMQKYFIKGVTVGAMKE